MPLDRIEINPRRRGHAGIKKQSRTKIETIRGEVTDVGVYVESAIGRSYPRWPGLGNADNLRTPLI